jgi:adenylylsulfate kinase
VITITAFISPYRKDRDINRELLGEGNFIEVYCKAPLDVCEERDPKGLYKKARAGELKGFTGIDDPYEEPLKPEMVIQTDQTSPQEATVALIERLESMGKIPPLHD